MHFNVVRTVFDTNDPPKIRQWDWRLVKSDGEMICRSPDFFDTEKEARSQLAAAKKSMKGASRCKVVTVNDD